MTTPRQTPRSKSRNIAARRGAQPAEPQSSTPPLERPGDADRQRTATESPSRHIRLSLREEEGDDTATRH
ncbi:hypothetical protein LVB87_03085 [Lysobacter sp. KIS68-7]|uniref:hypothetical protein n=1 Tax=Lysobacter sp. KIS68-7 TaxID=2904252 RepID=UPI001E34EFCF|nr:hypothetical protein [Lysobacter sp. KIS68-7]UHQ20160.1 hypothetical protein LVB87_03085 [Lysobacter sp. KIS68-7]